MELGLVAEGRDVNGVLSVIGPLAGALIILIEFEKDLLHSCAERRM